MQSKSSITISELVILRLAELGISQTFGVVGGAIMYITDALRRCKDLSTVFTHHEQGAAIAAEAYAKLTHKPALVFATAGPGATNVITGVVDAYMDSVPMVVLIGDVRSTIAADFSKQRYNAPQEVNQAELMRPIVKEYLYLEPHMDASTIIELVDRIVQTAMSERPGPVCISMPLDVQGMACDPAALQTPIAPPVPTAATCDQVAALSAVQTLLQARRPLILLGAGVRISGMAARAEQLIARYALPWCVTIGAVDLQDNANPLSAGCVGPTSQRAANTLFHAADCVLALGTSFDQNVTGFNIAELIGNKKVYLVNVDPGESLRFDDTSIEPIPANLSDFFDAIEGQKFCAVDHDPWLAQVLRVKATLTSQLEAAMRSTVGAGFLSAYDVTATLARALPADATIVLGISLDAHSVFNAFDVKRGQRVIVSRNLGPMGWDIPALVGAAFAADKPKFLVLITGDGSLMLNVQELAVIAGMCIPALILVFNNDGYVSIRSTQTNFFGPQFFGCNTASGLHIPPLEPLAHGFGLEFDRLEVLADIGPLLEKHVRAGKPRLIECQIDPGQLREPRLVSRVVKGNFKTPALRDMTPALPAEVAQSVARIFL
ncbi:MAG: thiamine pyrophosphate-binding protein [Actinobacteria bacterium]|nr:thiamine pyrophosphate-binding protein [Actinomycetota bacterium]